MVRRCVSSVDPSGVPGGCAPRHMPQLRGAAAILVAAGLLAGAARGQVLNAAVERLILDHKLGGATVAVCAMDLETGTTLASVRAREPMIPASNMKLLASGAALDVLGEQFAFRTELLSCGGSLVLRGSGDPSLGDTEALAQAKPRMTAAELLARLGAAVRDGGVPRVDAVIVDDRIFDRQFIHPSWDPNDLSKAYAAEVCGVNFHGNVVTAYPSPSPRGTGYAPVIVLEPDSPWVEVVNKARTAGKGNGSPWVTRDGSDDLLTLFGEVSQRVAIDVSVHDASRVAGRLLAAELLHAGVSVGGASAGAPGTKPSREALSGAYAAVRAAAPDERLQGGRVLAVVTTPLEDVLRLCNTDSENLYAECLLKRVGHEVTGQPGSWANGASVVRMRLAERLGPEFAAQTVIADGSGLSRDNRVSALTLARWLAEIGAGEHAAAFVESLASPGKGTLRRRFREVSLRNELFAKSGSIEGVRCLSGYVVGADGRKVAFSLLVNGLKSGQNLAALKLHEGIVEEIDSWLGSAAAAEAAQRGR
jgi:serine-type D-Ala-D-Ala carboxypeptidase/endopeptidase (penicillin-binding protein 4)